MKKFSVMLLLMVISVLLLSACGEVKDGKYAELAKCLTAKGAKFYGAFWCPHCQEQKAIFGDDARYLTYIECDARDPKGQPELCAEAKIDRYPTWVFPGLGKETGLHQPEELAKAIGCESALAGGQQTTETAGQKAETTGTVEAADGQNNPVVPAAGGTQQ